MYTDYRYYRCRLQILQMQMQTMRNRMSIACCFQLSGWLGVVRVLEETECSKMDERETQTHNVFVQNGDDRCD